MITDVSSAQKAVAANAAEAEAMGGDKEDAFEKLKAMSSLAAVPTRPSHRSLMSHRATTSSEAPLSFAPRAWTRRRRVAIS